MPIYAFLCPTCHSENEHIRPMGDTTSPNCRCGATMQKLMNFPAMVKMKGGGSGGYPSRRKFFHGSAPYSGGAKEWRPDKEHKDFDSKE